MRYRCLVQKITPGRGVVGSYIRWLTIGQIRAVEEAPGWQVAVEG
jgi:hypothetical protein